MHVELSNEQFGLLKRVADLALTELKVEVRRTSIREYHDELKREEEQLKEIVARLDEVVAH